MPSAVLTPNRKNPVQFGDNDTKQARARKLNENTRNHEQRLNELERKFIELERRLRSK